MEVKTFDPKQVIATFAGIPISGFAEGTFIRAERNVDTFSQVTGADGEGVRVKSNNKSGRVTFTLLQSALTNDLLSAVMQLDELSNNGIGPLLIVDKGGRTVVSAVTAWITKPPAVEMATTAVNREWVIETNEMQKFVGGN